MVTTTQLSHRVTPLRQSGIRKASTRCNEIGGINLGQGVCDIPTHDNIKSAAALAIHDNKNLYAPLEGLLELRLQLADKIQRFNAVTVDPKTEILIGHGSTGAFVAASKTLFNPGDEVVLFEPFYGYHKHILELLGIKTQIVPMDLDTYAIDFDQLQKCMNSKTRGLVLCTPCNPSGKVFTRAELITIGELAKQHNLTIITDEIYEYFTYPGHEHISLASLNDYWARTITISGFSKTYNVTGWRLGYAYGPAAIISKMALVHDLLYVCPPTPLQHAMLSALALDADFYQTMRLAFLKKRDLVVTHLRAFGFKVKEPQGAYYLMANFAGLGFKDDEVMAAELLEHAKVATVPGRAFYQDPESGRNIVRFCFALDEAKLSQAMTNMQQFFSAKQA